MLEYADSMTITEPDVSDELFARLRARFDEDAIVELTEIVAWENASRNCALRVPSQEPLLESRVSASRRRAPGEGDACVIPRRPSGNSPPTPLLAIEPNLPRAPSWSAAAPLVQHVTARTVPPQYQY